MLKAQRFPLIKLKDNVENDLLKLALQPKSKAQYPLKYFHGNIFLFGSKCLGFRW